MSLQDSEIAGWYAKEIRPHEAGLRSWLRARFPALADPEDLLQESFLRLLRARERGHVSNPKAFLFATARNAALDLFRRQNVISMEPLVSESASFVQEDRPSVPEIVSRSQEIEILHEAIKALPPRCREIMTLQKIHGFSNRRIAERLGISINTVNAQLVIGLVRCRAYLRERGVFGPKQ